MKFQGLNIPEPNHINGYTRSYLNTKILRNDHEKEMFWSLVGNRPRGVTTDKWGMVIEEIIYQNDVRKILAELRLRAPY